VTETLTLDPADTAELVESTVNDPVLFSGVRTYVVNGVAHFLFYVEQPDSRGRIEYVIVQRMAAPLTAGPLPATKGTRREGSPFVGNYLRKAALE
jgi:hypothetical protein